MTFAQTFALVSHRLSLIFFGLATVAMYASDPPNLLSYMAAWKAALIWPLAAVMHLSLFVMGLLVFALLTRQFQRCVTFTPLVGALALTPTVLFSEWLAGYLSNGVYPPSVMQNFPFYFLSVQVFETVFIRFVVPLTDVLKETGAADSGTRSDRHILIGGRSIPVDDLHHIEARKHFVKIKTEDGEIEQRARMSDILAQTKGDDGIQPHRSWWVSQHARPRLDDDDGRPVLRLLDNTVVPIARARLEEVRRWLEKGFPAE
ncbi:LytTR family transcriptional regulator DNA-binding domain-containing protein [Mesobacterium sp. TK19101]|uniref:LytTR family transcriptional regulator DNA-binding domain-containing protein n=1 Tax=Mesobacterium hydrothermale TaxID=3111907 RepID=A0ABU6HCL4_9RHOB|nr:LytTR family transcriptional regulator DNA-binding domain-containing protein [Mesobacterium sp. TK19101]MEC3860203.1 LytTR family transcriptional regulator DNA-binding domain-containing protein [Mesobacterium sp. TK19101]